jgi:hypothetical protein
MYKAKPPVYSGASHEPAHCCRAFTLHPLHRRRLSARRELDQVTGTSLRGATDADLSGLLSSLIEHAEKASKLAIADVPQEWRFRLREVFWEKYDRL